MAMLTNDEFYSRAFHKYICEGYSQDLSRELAEKELKQYQATWSSYSTQVQKARKGYCGNDKPTFSPLEIFKDKVKNPNLIKYTQEIERYKLKSNRSIARHFNMPYSALHHLQRHCIEEIIDAWNKPRDKKGRLVFN